MEIMKRLVREEEGQGMVEYALIIALVSVGLVAGLGLFKTQIAATFTKITGSLTNANTAN